MSVLQYFKNTPGRPHMATGPKCNFFSNLQRRHWKKRGPVAPHPAGDRGSPPYIRSNPPSLLI